MEVSARGSAGVLTPPFELQPPIHISSQPKPAFLRPADVQTSYRFRIQPLFGGAQPCFQLTIGMAGDRDFEMIPAHRSAFAWQIEIKEFHPTQADAQIELSTLLEWMHTHRSSRSVAASMPS
jgi:hypothetical protein